MGRHIVRPLRVVLVAGAIRHGLQKVLLHIVTHGGIAVFIQREGGGGVL